MPVQESRVELGPVLGSVSVLQLDEASFHSSCLQKNSEQRDSTGCRVYAACHVLCRFIALHPELFKNKRVIEIGCGVGIAGIAACLCTDLSHILLTDGNENAITIAQQNIINSALNSMAGVDSGAIGCRAHAQTYHWGDPVPAHPASIEGISYDVLIGSELCYYNTDMSLLVSTAQKLLGEDGIFIHAHIFRKADQEEEMIKCFKNINWTTAEVKVTSVVSEAELRVHDSAWYRVRCLLSGPRHVITTLIDSDTKYIEFRPQNPLDTEEDGSDDGAFGLGAMFS